MKNTKLSVALPWSLSHYIPLNAFHPLYRALFDECPEDVTLNAWDNIELSGTLRGEPATRQAFVKHVQSWERKLKEGDPSPLRQAYQDAFFTPNLAATALLPGELELHHTAAFPSMTRPFALHCESFMPVFFPFSQQGGGTIAQAQAMRAHYEQIFSSPLCLGIFSHIPHTLAELSRFFHSPVIDQKLFPSRIGLSGKALPRASADKPAPGSAPSFLFINSANQNPANFLHRGGHIVLRAWPTILARYPGAKLLLRCGRPEDALLAAHGVDPDFLACEQGRSVIWIEEFLTHHELNRLMGRVNFFLLPSISLHSVSIMQAMALGAVPIVSDTIGTSRYVTHGKNGIVLQGVVSAHFAPDPETGILVDHYDRSPELDDSLVAQVLDHVMALLGEPAAYATLRAGAMAHAAAEFSGAAFAAEFWQQLRELAAKAPAVPASVPFGGIASLRHCLVTMPDWPRIFESVPQPMPRIYTGVGKVTELGGAFLHCKPVAGMHLHDWSALAEFCRQGGIQLTFAPSIGALNGKYLTAAPAALRTSRLRHLAQAIARLLYPYPPLYRFSARVLRWLRRLRARFQPPREPERQDVQLLAQNVSGLNIIRSADRYYAIPQDEGAFSATKVDAGGYRVSFKGSSMRQVMNQIAEFDAANGGGLDPAAQLAEEGVDGLNIIHCADLFFAIPQSEGAFDYRRALAKGYSRVVIGQSLSEVKTSILGSAS